MNLRWWNDWYDVSLIAPVFVIFVHMMFFGYFEYILIFVSFIILLFCGLSVHFLRRYYLYNKKSRVWSE